ncbi:MAG: CHAT domain-containing protein [Gammaproteobacteria bacterium]|nr:CHAT domain-containing protein [Gammaproteobacteria bacterium]
MDRKRRNALFDVLNQYFELADILDLCFRLGVDKESFTASGKSGLIRLLIEKIGRAGGLAEVQLPELVEEARGLQPDLDWSAVLPPKNSQKENGGPVTLATILILSANPLNTARLRLDAEVREIDEGLRRARHREKFKLVSRWAVRARDVRRALLDEKPAYVHFCGHGEGEAGLLLEDNDGAAKAASAEALAALFKLFASDIRCVVLNTCYSKVQAEAIARHIPHVAGMSHAIGDQAAMVFSTAFYDALGAGEKVPFAYEYACSAIQLEGISEHLIPVLIPKR